MSWPRERLTGRLFVGVWTALLLLTLISFGFSYMRLGAWEVTVALLIAAVKGALVALFFMHLITERFVLPLILIISGLWVALLAGLTAADVATRAPPDLEPPLGRVSGG